MASLVGVAVRDRKHTPVMSDTAATKKKETWRTRLQEKRQSVQVRKRGVEKEEAQEKGEKVEKKE